MRISIFDNQHAAIKELPEDQQGAFWVDIMAYVFDDITPTFEDPLERITWQLITPYLDKAKTNSENGKKGGRKPGGKSGDKKRNETETKANENRNESENKANKKRNETEPLSENENEREGLGVSLKDTLTPSPRVDAAGGKDPATPSAEDYTPQNPDTNAYEARDMNAYLDAFNAESAKEHPDAIPCPFDYKTRLRQVFDDAEGGAA